MVTRRAFTKSLGGAVAVAALNPILGWAVDEPKISPEAAKLYRDSFILDGNALASMGRLCSEGEQDEVTAGIGESGITAIKATLGGAIDDFAMAVAAIARAGRYVEERADLFV